MCVRAKDLPSLPPSLSLPPSFSLPPLSLSLSLSLLGKEVVNEGPCLELGASHMVVFSASAGAGGGGGNG